MRCINVGGDGDGDAQSKSGYASGLKFHALVPWRPKALPGPLATQVQSEEPRTPADLGGQALVLKFRATGCAPCRLALPALHATMAWCANPGLRLPAIHHGEMPERVRRHLGELPVHGTVLLERSQAQLRPWVARALPASLVLDATGRPRFMAIGEIDGRIAHVVEALGKVVAACVGNGRQPAYLPHAQGRPLLFAVR